MSPEQFMDEINIFSLCFENEVQQMMFYFRIGEPLSVDCGNIYFSATCIYLRHILHSISFDLNCFHVNKNLQPEAYAGRESSAVFRILENTQQTQQYISTPAFRTKQLETIVDNILCTIPLSIKTKKLYN